MRAKQENGIHASVPDIREMQARKGRYGYSKLPEIDAEVVRRQCPFELEVGVFNKED